MDSADPRIRCRKFSSQGKKVKAVIPVHLAGYPCDISTIRDAVENDEVKIIEDAAHAFPSRHPAGIVGDIGDIGVFSFYATKTITTGEGGMIATRNPEYLERMRVMRLHGIDRTVWNRYGKNAGSRPWEYDVVAPGYKYNMTDLAAAIGRVQLHRADFLLGERRRLASLYNEALGDLKGVFLPEDRPGHAWHLYILRLERPEMRDALAESLGREGIGVSVHFRPLHRMTYWKNKYSMNPDDYPRAEKLADTILSLPLWPGMKDKNLRRVIRSVRRVVHG